MELADILRLLRQNRLLLPGVPELASQIRQAVADPASNVNQVASIVSADPALAAHLIKVARSVAYRRGGEVHSVRAAVTRLGLRLTAVSATGFSIMQMMALAGGQQTRIRLLYQHSVAVGARCYALSRRLPALVAEDALLLGLVHDIGALPVLQYAHRQREALAPDRLQALIDAVHAPVGAELLRNWRFPEALAAAVAGHENRGGGDGSDGPGYADLLIAANLDAHGGAAPLSPDDIGSTPALRRLGAVAGAPLTEQLGLAADISVAHELCGLDERTGQD